MAVTVDPARKTKNIRWDESALVGDTVDLKAEHGNDVSTRDGLVNDGAATVTFPMDYHGTSHITITDEDGNTEEGDITV